jgi:hypothetical protein
LELYFLVGQSVPFPPNFEKIEERGDAEGSDTKKEKDEQTPNDLKKIKDQANPHFTCFNSKKSTNNDSDAPARMTTFSRRSGTIET